MSDKIQDVFDSFVEDGLLEPSPEEVGTFQLAPRGIIFMDVMFQIYGFMGMAERTAQLVNAGRFDNLDTATKKTVWN